MKKYSSLVRKIRFYCGILLVVFILVACNTQETAPITQINPTTIPSQTSSPNQTTSQQAYPAPESLITEEQLSGYPGPQPETIPSHPPPIPTPIPPVLCEINSPNHQLLSYTESNNIIFS